MKIHLAALFIIFAWLSGSCSLQKVSPQHSEGGVEVGNGALRYYSQRYRYSISYPTSFTLTEHSAERVTLQYVSSANTGKALIEIQSLELSESDREASVNLDKLESYVNRIEPDARFKRVAINGTESVCAEKTLELNSMENCYIPAPDANLISVRAVFGNALKDVARSVLNSFRYDDRPPVVLEVKADEPMEAGSLSSFQMKIEDNLSGVASSFEASVCKDDGLTSHWYCNNMRKMKFILKPLGDGWFQAQSNFNKYMSAGEYFIKDFELTDLAGNVSPHYLLLSKGYIRFGHDLPTLNEIRFTVTNSGLFDDKVPLLRRPRFTKGRISAEQSNVLCFDGEVGVTGLADLQVQLRSTSGGFQLDFAELRNVQTDLQNFCVTFQMPQDACRDEYALVGGHHRSNADLRGQLEFNFPFPERLAKFYFEGKDCSHTPDLSLERLETDRSAYGPGSRGLLRIKFSDPSAIVKPVPDGRVAVRGEGRVFPIFVLVNFLTERMYPQGEGWHVIPFVVSPYAKPGRYYIHGPIRFKSTYRHFIVEAYEHSPTFPRTSYDPEGKIPLQWISIQ